MSSCSTCMENSRIWNLIFLKSKKISSSYSPRHFESHPAPSFPFYEALFQCLVTLMKELLSFSSQSWLKTYVSGCSETGKGQRKEYYRYLSNITLIRNLRKINLKSNKTSNLLRKNISCPVGVGLSIARNNQYPLQVNWMKFWVILRKEKIQIKLSICVRKLAQQRVEFYFKNAVVVFASILYIKMKLQFPIKTSQNNR